MEALNTPKEFPVLCDSLNDLIRTGFNPSDFKGAAGMSFSCGITQLYGLYGISPSDMVHKILKERAFTDRKKIKEAFVMFSDTIYGSGNSLYKYIKDNNLGNIVEFGPRMNPNTGNMIKLWVWEPPHQSLQPKDKYMPVYGKIMTVLPSNIGGVRYDDDPRFQSGLKSQTQNSQSELETRGRGA